MQPTVFYRSDLYKETYLTRVLPYPAIKKKFRDFMEVKRNNPNQIFGASDKNFTPGGVFFTMIPGLRHAHLTPDLSIVYRVVGNQIYLYGFFNHDDIGTGQPPKIPKQKAMASKFARTVF